MARLDSGLRFDSGIRMDVPASQSRKRNMNKILRHWTKLGRAARAVFFRKIADNLAKTPPPLANPNPPLTEYEALVAAAEQKLADVAQLEQDLKAARLAATDALDAAAEATEKMARRTEDATDGVAEAMVAVGFLVASDEISAPVDMAMPEEVAVTAGDSDGEIDWQCRPVDGAKSYETCTSAAPTDAASWKTHTAVTRSSGTIAGLPSGTRQYVKVRAIGPNGPGPWSDVASKMVP